MCICMNIYTYTHVLTYFEVNTTKGAAYICACIHKYKYTHVFIYLEADTTKDVARIFKNKILLMYVHICVYVHVNICVSIGKYHQRCGEHNPKRDSADIYVHMCIYAYIHVCIHLYLYADTIKGVPCIIKNKILLMCTYICL